MTNAVKCKSCGALIYWDTTANRKICPYNIVDGKQTTVSHFTTCDNPKRFSGKGRQTP